MKVSFLVIKLIYTRACRYVTDCAFDDKSMKFGSLVYSYIIPLGTFLAIGIFQITPRVKMVAI